MKHAKQTDKNQKAIVEYLQKGGLGVEIIGRPLDLLVARLDSFWIMLEVKGKDGDVSRGQIEYMAFAKGFCQVVTDGFEALNAVQFPKKYCLTRRQRDRLAAWLIKNPERETINVNQFRKVIK